MKLLGIASTDAEGYLTLPDEADCCPGDRYLKRELDDGFELIPVALLSMGW